MVLRKLVQSGNYKEFTKITMMFLLSIVAGVLFLFTFYRWYRRPDNPFLIMVFSLFWFIYLGALAIGHWIFAYEYFNMVRIIPFVLDYVPPPENIVK